MQKYADYTPAQAAWLDELPSHWQCTKIGALFSERKSKVSDKDYAPLSVCTDRCCSTIGYGGQNRCW